MWACVCTYILINIFLIVYYFTNSYSTFKLFIAVFPDFFFIIYSIKLIYANEMGGAEHNLKHDWWVVGQASRNQTESVCSNQGCINPSAAVRTKTSIILSRWKKRETLL